MADDPKKDDQESDPLETHMGGFYEKQRELFAELIKAASDPEARNKLRSSMPPNRHGILTLEAGFIASGEQKGMPFAVVEPLPGGCECDIRPHVVAMASAVAAIRATALSLQQQTGIPFVGLLNAVLNQSNCSEAPAGSEDVGVFGGAIEMNTPEGKPN